MWLLDNFVAWLDSYKMEKSKHHLKWDCILCLRVFCLFVFIPWDECDSFLHVENTAKRRQINTALSRAAMSSGCWSDRVIFRLWCPPCSIQTHIPQQAGVVPCHHVKSAGHLLQHTPLFFCCWSGNQHLPFCCYCHPSFYVTSFHLQIMCVVLSAFHSRII